MPTVEIITIGTELLLGDVQDTNTRFIASHLKIHGYDLFRISVVGDNQNRIAQLLQEALNRSDIIITTGGLGPTVDDPTRESVSQAFGVPLRFIPELWNQIEKRFTLRGVTPTDNNRKQAMIPDGSIPIENKYGTAPGFILQVESKFVICLQGVPHEMEHLFKENVLPFILEKMPPSHNLITRVLHTIGIGESTLDSLVGEFELLDNPTVGLLAHAGIVDIRLVASAYSKDDAEKLINTIEEKIRLQIPNNIFGVDEEEISGVISKLATRLPAQPTISLFGFPDDFQIEIPEIAVNYFPASSIQPHKNLDFDLVFLFDSTNELIRNQLWVIWKSQSKITRTYLGPPESFLEWAKNTIYYYIWMEVKNRVNRKIDEKN